MSDAQPVEPEQENPEDVTDLLAPVSLTGVGQTGQPVLDLPTATDYSPNLQRKLGLHVEQEEEPETPWGKRAKETALAHSAFTIYLQLGEGRTLGAAEDIYRTKRGLPPTDRSKGRSVSASFWEWVKKNEWRKRAGAYDEWLLEQEIGAQKRQRVRARTRQASEVALATKVLMHPLEKYREKLNEIAEGTLPDDLDMLSQEQLLALGRQTAALLKDLHKSEREALGEEVEPSRINESALKMKGQMLRQLLSNPDAVGTLEKVSWELVAAEREQKQPDTDS